MDEILKLELRMSEARQELADLLEKDADNEKIGTLNIGDAVTGSPDHGEEAYRSRA